MLSHRFLLTSFLTVSSLFGSGVESQTTCQLPLDILFVLDSSTSMAKPMHSLSLILYDIMRQYYKNRDVMMGLVGFGGQPTLLLPLIPKMRDNRDFIRTAFRWLDDNVGSSKAGFTTQKASLEALRMVLANNSGSDLRKSCVSTSFCNLNWRNGAERLIVLVTDDGSDLPVAKKYRMPNQDSSKCFPENPLSAKPNGPLSDRSDLYKPSFTPSTFFKTSDGWIPSRNSNEPLKMDPTFVAEVNATVQLLASTQTGLLLIAPSTKVSKNGIHSGWNDRNPICASLKCKNFEQTWVAHLQYGNSNLAQFIHSPKPWSVYNREGTRNAFKGSQSLSGQLFGRSLPYGLVSFEAFMSVSHENQERMFLAAVDLRCKPSAPINQQEVVCESLNQSEECFYNGIVVPKSSTTTAVSSPSPHVVLRPAGFAAAFSAAPTTTSTSVAASPSPVVVVAKLAQVSSSSTTTTASPSPSKSCSKVNWSTTISMIPAVFFTRSSSTTAVPTKTSSSVISAVSSSVTTASTTTTTATTVSQLSSASPVVSSPSTTVSSSSTTVTSSVTSTSATLESLSSSVSEASSTLGSSSSSSKSTTTVSETSSTSESSTTEATSTVLSSLVSAESSSTTYGVTSELQSTSSVIETLPIIASSTSALSSSSPAETSTSVLVEKVQETTSYSSLAESSSFVSTSESSVHQPVLSTPTTATTSSTTSTLEIISSIREESTFSSSVAESSQAITSTSELKVAEPTTTSVIEATTTSELKAAEPTTTSVIQPTTTSELKVIEPTTTSEIQPTTTSELKVAEPTTTSVIESTTTSESKVAEPTTTSVIQPTTTSELKVVEPTTTSELKVSEPTSSSSIVTQVSVSSVSSQETSYSSSIVSQSLALETSSFGQSTTPTPTGAVGFASSTPTGAVGFASSTPTADPLSNNNTGTTPPEQDETQGGPDAPVGVIVGALAGAGAIGAAATFFFRSGPSVASQIGGPAPTEWNGNQLNPLYKGTGMINPLFENGGVPDEGGVSDGWDQIVHPDLESSMESVVPPSS